MNINHLRHSQLVNQQQSPKSPSEGGNEKPLFLSRAQRFVPQMQDTPGPGAYDGILKEKHTSDYRVEKGNRQGQIASHHQWIFSNGRFSLPCNTNKNVGPGLYNLEHNMQSSNSSWAKKERFDEVRSFNNPLGPGQYSQPEPTLPRNEKKSQFSVFKSRSPRTFFQELVMKQQQKAKKANPEDQQLQVGQQVVNFDETTYPIRKKVEKLSPVFLSKITRPQLISDHLPQQVGPGSYSLSLQRTVSQKNTGIISAMHYNINAIVDKRPQLVSKITPPGPGAYQTEAAPSELLKKKPLGIISKEERFKGTLSHQRNQMPGPGEYMQKRYTMINEDEFNSKNKIAFSRKAQKSHDFGKVGRATLRNKNDVPFGEYNVQLFDMNYKLKKQQEHYEKLKMMEVTLPAFNSKHHH